jgi:hypothetical protein
VIYGLIAGLLLGAGVDGHALRLVTLNPEEYVVLDGHLSDADARKAERTRRFIAWSAIVIYGLGAALCLQQSVWGLIIAIVFPAVGVAAVLVTGHKIDLFQAVLGVPQLLAAALSIAVVLGAL